MTNVKSLNFSKEMTTNSSTIYSDKLITVEKLMTKRQAIHKHLSLVVSTLHMFIFQICVLNAIFYLAVGPVMPKRQIGECRVLGLSDLFIYTAGNLIFFFYFFTLWCRAKRCADLSDASIRFMEYLKYFYLLPIQIIVFYFVSKNVCGTTTLSLTYNSVMTMHLFIEIFVVYKYMTWFQREVLEIENHEYFDNCKKSWDTSTRNSDITMKP